MSRRSLVVVWAFPWVIAAACGGRTGEDLPSYNDGGAGARFGSGGGTSEGGALIGRGGSAPPKPSAGGRAIVPPTAANGGTTSVGPFPAGGFGNVPGFGTGGTLIGCDPGPACTCGDCYSQCVCKLGALGSNGLCKDMCFGAGGVPVGAGGSAGAAGAVCFEPDGGVTVFCSVQTPLPSCCTPSGGCGIEINVSGNTSIPIQGGCQPLGQPGTVDGRCPAFGELLGMPTVAGPVGCCRSDGTCGLTVDVLDSFHIGCLPALKDGVRFPCASTGIVDAGRD